MNIKISETIKELRRAQNLTQDEVASALGVTYQSVSRWENGLSYPDITILPDIASFFGVTLEELFGIDSSAEEKILEELWNEADKLVDLDERISLAEKYAQRLPHNVKIERFRMRMYCQKGIDFCRERLSEIRKTCQFIMDHSEDSSGDFRWAVEFMILVENAEDLETWLALLDRRSSTTTAQALIERYDYRGEVEKFNESIQREIVDSLKTIFNDNFCKRDRQSFKNAQSRVDGQKAILSIIDALRDTSVEADAWIADRAFYYLRLAAGSFGAGLVEEGYSALEKTVDLCEVLMSIPEGTKLKYNTPVLDMIDCEVTLGTKALGKSYYGSMTNPHGWEWFNGVRDSVRYREQVERMEKICGINRKS